MKLEPFISGSGVSLYHGDCREILPTLELDWSRVVLVVDPVWPNAMPCLVGASDPWGLWAEMWDALPCLPKRAVVHLSILSDPRFLGAIPEELPFYRSVNLEYPVPSFVGRNVLSCEVAYLFGEPPAVGQSSKMFPGRVMSGGGKARSDHPCPRSEEHVRQLVGVWSEPGEIILDPCCGSGTTLVAAEYWGREAVGIEIVSEFVELGKRRLGGLELWDLPCLPTKAQV